ncbi:hypothetical protein TL16_g12207 [Triparma laevis f. inornata]|uniref:DOT1 domain-containing protein n=1 Tax=Triparma laevis f. inornata TaxID=1714386 RepID=A0A9W7BK84_9STRA|nr:hypothetical protein TL16_g12207 [Triparma laevis f. inornata]
MIGGCGSTLGGATHGSSATFSGRSATKTPPPVVAAIERANKMREEEERERGERGEEEIHFNTERIRKARNVYDNCTKLYSAAVGKRVAKREREECELEDLSFAYGEVSFEAVCQVITKIVKKFGKEGEGTSPPEGILQGKGGRYYDLGSGTGKTLIAASMLHEFGYVCGVEYLEGLFNTSQEIVSKWEKVFKKTFFNEENGFEESGGGGRVKLKSCTGIC